MIFGLLKKHIRLTQEPIDLSGMYKDESGPSPTVHVAGMNRGFNDCLDTLKQEYPERFK